MKGSIIDHIQYRIDDGLVAPHSGTSNNEARAPSSQQLEEGGNPPYTSIFVHGGGG